MPWIQALRTTLSGLFSRLNSSFGPPEGARSASSARRVHMMSSASEQSAAGRGTLFLEPCTDTAVTEACSDRARVVAVSLMRICADLGNPSFKLRLGAPFRDSKIARRLATLGHCVQISFR